jgi:hypothetical protein
MLRTEIIKLHKGVDYIKFALSAIGEGTFDIFKQRDAILQIFFRDLGHMDELFFYYLPVKKCAEICRQMLILSTADAVDGNQSMISQYGTITRADMISVFQDLLGYFDMAIRKHGYVIFYSWQSEFDTKNNRTAIQAALEKAISAINCNSRPPLQLDKDTANRAGTPDIVQTILDKIDNSFIVVADISIVESHNERYSPNANVLYEVGYAHGMLSESNIICVFNKASGNIQNLPFDLRHRRILQYELSDEQGEKERRIKKDELIQQLKKAIETITLAEIK